MTKRKGMTLVEVIVSVGILGVVAVGFFAFMSNHLSYLTKTQEISQEVFLAQGQMEKKIDDVKEAIRNGGEGLTPKTKRILSGLVTEGIPVTYYEVKETYENKPFYTLVSNIKPEVIEPITLDWVKIQLQQQLTSSKVDVTYGYGNSNFSVTGTFKNKDAFKWDHLLTVVEWYVSSDEYNMPLPQSDDFPYGDDILYYSYYYPVFPRDYTLVRNETVYDFGTKQATLPNIEKYRGRNIVFSATPGAKSGRIGVRMVTSPVFVSGLPVTDSLVLHLDANQVDPTGATLEVVPDSTDLEKWYDLSSVIGKSVPDQIASLATGSSRPSLLKTEMGTEFIGQYVRFTGSTKLTIGSQGTLNENIYVFAAVRNRSQESSAFLKSLTTAVSVEGYSDEAPDAWSIVKEAVKWPDNSFDIGAANVDVSEIIVYKGTPTDENIDLIQDYLKDKFSTPIVLGDIDQLRDMSNEITVGTPFELPDMVLADMVGGYQKYVSVEWSGTYNVDEPGVYKLTGKALADPLKKMTYTLTVTPE